MANFSYFQESKEYTLSLGRNHNKAGRSRKEPTTLYSESEEYDDTDTSGGETNGMTTSLHQTNPPIPPMHQNIFSASSNIHPQTGRNDPPSIVSSHVRMSHPEFNGSNPLPHHRPERLNNQQPSDPTKRQNLGREGVVMGERSLLTNRITNFNNNPSSGNMMNNNQRHHNNAVNSTLNNLNTHFSNSSPSSSATSSSAGANNLLGSNSTDYRQQLNL